MTLSQKQRKFVRMQHALVAYAYSLGYELTEGRAHVPGATVKSGAFSCHHHKLAKDWNLFIKGRYQSSTSAHALLGAFWKLMGGCWGGDFGDGNHYSLKHGGVR